MREDADKRVDVRKRDLDMGLQPPRPADRRIDDPWMVGGTDDDQSFRLHRAVHQFEQLVDQPGPVVVIVPAPVPAADAVDLVDEEDGRRIGERLAEPSIGFST